MRSLILCLLLLAVRATTLSAQYQDGPVRLLNVPAGFEGPEIEINSPGWKIAGFVREIPGTQRGTVLQVTTIDLDVAGLTLPDSGDVHPAESLVAEFLTSVELHRNNFQVASRDRIDLSGFPAARAEWRGTAGSGRDMRGVAYCVVVSPTVVVILHTQTFSDAPEDHLPAAVQAIESVVLQP